MQAPSFLVRQRDMERKRGRNNARSLFEVRRIPSDPQIRNLLGPVATAPLGAVFWETYGLLRRKGQLAAYIGVAGIQLIALDGTQQLSSQKLHCENCRVTVRDEQDYYSHQVLVAVLCAPWQPQVVCLEPEFITPQDGHEKQDCEQQAIKRWVQRHAARFEPWGTTILADDLHALTRYIYFSDWN